MDKIENNKILKRANKIKEDCKLEYCGNIGKFDNPFIHMSISEDKFVVNEIKDEKSTLIIGDLKDGCILDKFPFKKRILCIACDSINHKIYFVYWNEAQLWYVDINTGKSELLNVNESSNAISSIKIYEDNIYVVNPLTPSINIFSKNGELLNSYDLKNIFYFPYNFCLLNSEKIILERLPMDFLPQACLTDEIKKYNLNPDLVVLNITKGEISSIPKNKLFTIPDFLTQMTYIEKDHKGNIFIKNRKYIVKFNSSFNLLYKTNISNLISDRNDSLVDFYSFSINKDNLYILEIIKYKTIFKFKI